MKKVNGFYMSTILRISCVVLILSCVPKNTASQQQEARFAEFDEFVASMEKDFYIPSANSIVLTKEDFVGMDIVHTLSGTILPSKILPDGIYFIKASEGQFWGSSKVLKINENSPFSSGVNIPISNYELVLDDSPSLELFIEEAQRWESHSGYVVFSVSGGVIQEGVFTKPSLVYKSEILKDLGPVKETTFIPMHNYLLLNQIFDESGELLWQKQYETMLPVIRDN
jgi:hypothetical protein